jgi:hypothetical protein
VGSGGVEGICRVVAVGVERESGEDEMEEEGGVVRGWFAEKEGELEAEEGVWI